MSNKILLVFAVVQLFALINGQDDGYSPEAAADYDIGCFAAREGVFELIKDDYESAIADGVYLPTCEMGGLWANVQCYVFGTCFCVYVDTGKNMHVQPENPESIQYSDLVTFCPREAENSRGRCLSPPLTSPCELSLVKYRYDVDSESCVTTSIGCYGFKSRDECEAQCVNSSPRATEPLITTTDPPTTTTEPPTTKTEPPTTTTEPPTTTTEPPTTTTEPPTTTTEPPTTTTEPPTTTTEPPTTTTALAPEYDQCSHPLDVGQFCNRANGGERHWYNTRRGRCETFNYRGCQGNTNNYMTAWECQRACVPQESVTIYIRIESIIIYRIVIPTWVAQRYGLSDDVINDISIRQFVTLEEASSSTRLIQAPTPPPTTTTATTTTRTTRPGRRVPAEEVERRIYSPRVICRLPSKTGFCRGFFRRWYFNPETSRCTNFIYGGCQANGNNFRSYQACSDYCNPANPLLLPKA